MTGHERCLHTTVEAFDDLASHRHAWRLGLVNCMVRSEGHDKSYWQHELEVFDRTLAALSAPAVTTGEPFLWICIVPGKWEPENIRAWTRDPDRAAQLTQDGLDMKPLYAAPASGDVRAAVIEALEPFAKMADFVVESHRDSRPLVHGLDVAVLQRLTIGDLRRAKAALSQAPATHAERRTFAIPDGHEAVRDADGRATGEVRPTADAPGYMRYTGYRP